MRRCQCGAWHQGGVLCGAAVGGGGVSSSTDILWGARAQGDPSGRLRAGTHDTKRGVCV